MQQRTTVEESRIRRIPKLKGRANDRAWSTVIRSVRLSGPCYHGGVEFSPPEFDKGSD